MARAMPISVTPTSRQPHFPAQPGTSISPFQASVVLISKPLSDPASRRLDAVLKDTLSGGQSGAKVRRKHVLPDELLYLTGAADMQPYRPAVWLEGEGE